MNTWHPMLFEDELLEEKSSRRGLIFFEDLGIQDKNSLGGTHPWNPGGVCSKRDNDEGVYTSLVSLVLSSDLVER